jgi:carboxymethylenebutenolidase
MGETHQCMVDLGLGQGYWALPVAHRSPGVVVLHAWWGLTDCFRRVCDRLAQRNIAALAPDLYHGAVAPTDDEARRLRGELDAERALREIKTAIDFLRSHPAVLGDRVGMVGFSLGGYLALRSVRVNPSLVRAVVLFYATDGGDFRGAQASFLGHFATGDGCWAGARAVRSLEARLRAAGCEVIFHTYPGTEHSFFEADRHQAHNARAAELAWQRTVGFLHSKLGQARGATLTTAWPSPVLGQDIPALPSPKSSAPASSTKAQSDGKPVCSEETCFWANGDGGETRASPARDPRASGPRDRRTVRQQGAARRPAATVPALQADPEPQCVLW